MKMLRPPIAMSVFELLKAGPGPSSSHTIGPMRAGRDFAALVGGSPGARGEAGAVASARTAPADTPGPDVPAPAVLARSRGVRVRLLGSLSATGKGHGTDRAVLAGLMGYSPDNCPPELLNTLLALPQEERVLRVPGAANDGRLPIGPENIEYGPIQHSYPYSNTLCIDLLDVPFPAQTPEAGRGSPMAGQGDAMRDGGRDGGRDGDCADNAVDPLAERVLFSREYYSVGGGFLQWRGWVAEERGRPVYPYVNMNEVHVRLAQSGLALDELMMANETAITGASEKDIYARLDGLLEIMKDTVRRGCATHGLLPGAIGLPRKAGVLFDRAACLKPFDKSLCLLNAYAYAAAEENAAGNIIVTAPTCGAAGVVPAVTMFMEEQLGLDRTAQRKGLLAAALVGFIAKQNAGIAGAEVGCQGEIGVASSMAAAMLAEARGYSAKVVENAAEIALEHHLGLTCDPVGGYVQIPCIERNAMGAAKAYNAALIACNENPAAHMVSYDDALAAMAEIGRDMSCKYKETSTGGLAVCLVVC